jgi:hypothetical protein
MALEDLSGLDVSEMGNRAAVACQIAQGGTLLSYQASRLISSGKEILN